VDGGHGAAAYNRLQESHLSPVEYRCSPAVRCPYELDRTLPRRCPSH
jgi:hypothetical protein